MMDEVKKVNEEAKSVSRGETVEEETDLPAGNSPVTKEDEDESDPKDETKENAEPEKAAKADEDDAETLIKIGDREFKTQAEAIAYAESLEEDKLRSDIYAQGVKDALAQGKPAESAAEEVDDFDETFYANPKAKLAEVRRQATQDAINSIKADQAREDLWKKFFDEHPDLDGQRTLCEFTLNQNWETIGKMTDLQAAQKLLARKVRGVFQTYNERNKPTKELPANKTRAVSPGSGDGPGVTPEKKEEAPLTMAEQIRLTRKR